MAVNKVVYGNNTLIDLTEDTVSANNLLAGETAHDRSGASVVGEVVIPEVVDNLTTQDATKALSAKQGYVLNQNKVDKVSGKGLSTNDYTTEDKAKVTSSDSKIINYEDRGYLGKNLLKIDDVEIGVAWNGLSNSARARLVIPCNPSKTYILSMNGTNGLDGVYYESSESIPPSGISGVTFPQQITTRSTDKYITLGFNKTNISKADIEALKLQLELGSTATAYQPYVKSNIELDESVDNLKVTETGDTEPYLIRQSKGNMADIELVGGSVAWNQLVKCNRASTTLNNVTVTKVTGGYTLSGTASAYSERAFDDTADRPNVIANHVYFWGGLKANSNVTFYAYFAQGIATNTTKETIVKPSSGISNCNLGFTIAQGSQVNTTIYPTLIDLTQLFGTTIADAIYAMEQASTGSGVAFFRKYFPNAYYAYNGGEIISTKASERKVSGKNLCPPLEVGAIDTSTGQPVTNNTIQRSDFIGLTKGLTYTLSFVGGYTRIRVFRYNSSKTFLNSYTIDVQQYSTPIVADSEYIRFQVGISVFPLTGKAQLELGSVATEYVDYKAPTTYPLPNTELRGIPTLVDNKLKYDGDTLESNGKGTRKYGIVNLGSLTWTYVSGTPSYFHANLVDNKVGATGTYGKILSGNGYEVLQTKGSTAETMSKDKGIALQNGSHLVIVRDSAYTDATTFKTAMNGVYLVYELATPTTEDTTPFQNPQRANKDGIEEFVDYEYDWMQSRDVAMPVGHNTKYISSEALAYSEDYADGLLKYVENDLIPPKADITALTNYDFSGMTTAPLSISKDDYFYMDGSLCKALVDINQGATLTYYTNYKTCSVATELNELRNKTEWHEVMSGTHTLSTTEDETLMWVKPSYLPTYFGCDFFVFSDLAGFYLKDFSYGGNGGSITFPKWSSAVTVKYKIMARGEANQSGSGITTYYNAPILNQ